MESLTTSCSATTDFDGYMKNVSILRRDHWPLRQSHRERSLHAQRRRVQTGGEQWREPPARRHQRLRKVVWTATKKISSRTGGRVNLPQQRRRGRLSGKSECASRLYAHEQQRAQSIFSVQVSVNDGSGGLNGNSGDVLNFPFIPGQNDCCGFFSPSQYLVNHFKTDSRTGLPDLDHFNDNDVKHDNGLLSSQPFTPYNGTLDPRLDWTVGRRGIPYLDWGNHPGATG